jgi:hypothetical protein
MALSPEKNAWATNGPRVGHQRHLRERSVCVYYGCADRKAYEVLTFHVSLRAIRARLLFMPVPAAWASSRLVVLTDNLAKSLPFTKMI